MFKVLNQTDNDLVAIRVESKIEKDDYNKLNQLIDGALAKNRKANLYIEMGELEGVSPSAVWEDLKFDFKHYDDLNKIAIVGEADWEKWLTNVSNMFTSADVKFFEKSKDDEAYEWLGVSVAAES